MPPDVSATANDALETLPPPGSADAVYLVDLSGYIYRAYHATPPLRTSKGEPTNAVFGVTQMLLLLVAERKPAYLGAAMDSRTRTFRDALFAEYKAHRPSPPEDLRPQFARVEQILAAYAIPALRKDGYEADDVIATATETARKKGLTVVIVTGDKDLMQLVGPGVLLYDTMRQKVYGPRAVQEKFGVRPDQIVDLLALMGDSTDNVPGVAGIGEKTAAQLLGEHGTLDALLANPALAKKPKLVEALGRDADAARLSRKLVTLAGDVPIDFDLGALRYGGADLGRLRDLFVELEFKRLLAELDASLGTGPARAVAAEPAGAPAFETLLSEDDLRRAADAIEKAGRLALRSEANVGNAVAEPLVGIGLAWRSGHGAYLPLEHRYLGVPQQLRAPAALDILRPILESDRVKKATHEGKRDDIFLRRLGVRLAGVDADTMVESYLLDPERHQHRLDQVAEEHLGSAGKPPTYDEVTEKGRGHQLPYGEVAVEAATKFAGAEALAVLALAKPLDEKVRAAGCEALLRDVELPLSDVLATIELCGVRLDVEALARLGTRVREDAKALEHEIQTLAGEPFNVNSTKQLQAILFEKLKLPVVRKTKTGYSTDGDALEELAAIHPLPAKILEHRSLVKLQGTYIETLPQMIDKKTGRIHTSYSQAVAATGRLSSSDPNLQNIPIRSPIGLEIRRAFVAEPGWSMLSADYSQIELRVLAHLSSDPVLTDAFRRGEDVHDRTAREVFGVPPEGVTPELRRRAKTINFGVIYGQTDFGLGRQLGISKKEAGKFIATYFERYQGVAAYMDRMIAEARKEGAVKTLLGRRRAIRDINSENRVLRGMAERIARNAPIQGTAADIIKIAMVRVERRIEAGRMRARMLLTVHDELVFEAPPEERDTLEGLVRKEMEGAMSLSVPLVVDVGWGTNWAEAH